MSASHISANNDLLIIFWVITLSMLGAAFFLCFGVIIRRIVRNHQAVTRAQEKAIFQTYLKEALKRDVDEQGRLEDAPYCSPSEMADVLLHYFRTLRGEKLEQLKEMTSGSVLEDSLVKETFKGIRGSRMRALRTLSYLNSQKSLQVIVDNLDSEDKYVRLTAARCLVLRESDWYLNSILESIHEAFPQDYKLLAGILEGFGADIVEPLEDYIVMTENNVLKTACLETLILIRPPQTSLDLNALMHNDAETVRAAALALSTMARYDSGRGSAEEDPLRLGLKDKAISVKIRAAKMACAVRRQDIISDLYKLTEDPVMWVRYWALRAIWMSGQSGQKFVESLVKSNDMAGSVAREMTSGYV
ncbi:HEAT repeat domain-containing protein [Hellea balneolensis]|uniref:HEAT repeat domain-containing protein n=1 Tax=Hellea balneolensis TaxID=287478 RepID=UPI00047A9293|nr:HEAT repeat domain-containing protein [Hellea balneolensis]